MDNTKTDLEVKPEDPESGGQENSDEGENEEVSVEELKELHEREKVGLVGQIKELRAKLHQAVFVKSDDKKPEEKSDEVEDKIRSVLLKEKQEKMEINRKTAFLRFVEKHPEFNPDNDLSGIRNDALMQSYKRLNTQNSVSEEDILGDLESAYLLMTKSLNMETKFNINQFAKTPLSNVQTRATETNKLSPEQEKLRIEKGWTVEKYIQMKIKYPKIVL